MTTNHRIEYNMRIKFQETDVELTVEFTGESIRFEVADNTLIRPRHVKLVADIQQLIREYIRK